MKHEDAHDTETPGTKAADAKDAKDAKAAEAKDALTSGIPEGYVPDPYPGWRWNDKTGEGIIVTGLEDDAAKRAEGYTDRKPPPASPEPPIGTPTEATPTRGGHGPEPNQDLPPYRRPRIHDGD